MHDFVLFQLITGVTEAHAYGIEELVLKSEATAKPLLKRGNGKDCFPFLRQP